MKPLAAGLWYLSGSLEARLAWCARAGFRWIECDATGRVEAPIPEQLEAHGLHVFVTTARPLRAEDPALEEESALPLLWDTWTAHRLGLDARRYAHRIAHVRFSDGTRERRTALGAGEVELRAAVLDLRPALLRMPCWGLDFEGCPHASRELQKATGFLRELTRASRR